MGRTLQQLGASVAHLLAHDRVRDGRDISVAQLGDDGFGRLRGKHKALPGPNLEAAKSGDFRDRRNTEKLGRGVSAATPSAFRAPAVICERAVA